MRPTVVTTVVLLALGAAPCRAEVYYTDQEALALAFPAADETQTVRSVVTDTQRAQIAELAGPGTVPRLFTHRVARKDGNVLGYAVIGDVLGKQRPITYLLAVDADLRVTLLEILAYRESHGGEIRRPSFRAQFTGKTSSDPLRLREDIANISGATISCRAVTDAVRRDLACLTVLLGRGQYAPTQAPEDGPEAEAVR